MDILLPFFQPQSIDTLTTVGRRCVVKGHEQAIKMQGFALSDLRKKIEQLISTNPPGVSYPTCMFYGNTDM